MVAIATRRNRDGDTATVQAPAEDELTDHLQEAKDAENTWRFGGMALLLLAVICGMVVVWGVWALVAGLFIAVITSVMATMAVSGQTDPENSQRRGG